MQRHELTEREWALIEPHTLGKPGTAGGTGTDNKLFINALVWRVHTYRAGLEPADAPRETHQFDSLSVTIAFATARAHTSGYVARLNAGGSAPQPLGPLI